MNTRTKIKLSIIAGVALLSSCQQEGILHQIDADANKQNDQISDLIAQGCQAVIIAAADSAAIEVAIDECADAGVLVCGCIRLNEIVLFLLEIHLRLHQRFHWEALGI